MILGRPLSAEERKRAQARYHVFGYLNGASYMCLGENMMILFAAQLQAPSAVIAVLGAMVYIGYIGMPLGVLRTARVGAAACQADFWLGRNTAALIIALSAFAAPFSLPLSWAFVLTGSFFFYACRGAGCVLSTPLVGDIATDDEVAIVINRNSGAFNLSGLATLVAITLVLYANKVFFDDGIYVLSGVIGLGSVIGMTSSTVMRRVDESGAVLAAARKKFLPEMKAAFANADIRRLAAGWFAVNFSQILMVPISILALKRGARFGSTSVLLCSALSLAAGTAVSRISGKLNCSFGPRYVIKNAHVLYLFVILAWLLFPSSAAGGAAAWIMAVLIFAVSGAATFCMNNSTPVYFLMVCPDKERQVFSSISLQLVVSVGAGLAGMAFSSGLIALAEGIFASGLGMEWMHSGVSPILRRVFPGDMGPFKLYFLMTLPLILVLRIPVLRLRKVMYEYHRRYGHDAVVRLVRMAHIMKRHHFRFPHYAAAKSAGRH